MYICVFLMVMNQSFKPWINNCVDTGGWKILSSVLLYDHCMGKVFVILVSVIVSDGGMSC